jgi:hypothetical protein
VDVTPHGLTRREALQGAGASLLGLVLAGPASAYADDGTGAGLDPAHAATLTAVVAALAQGPAAGVDPDAYTAGFTAFYRDSEPAFQHHAALALERLAPLAAMDAASAYAELQIMTLDPGRQLDAADALTLGGLSFEADDLRQAGYYLVTG